VESIGVHIESKRGFGIFKSIEFLPWDIIEDIFINEVVKGVSILITFLINIYRNDLNLQLNNFSNEYFFILHLSLKKRLVDRIQED